MRVGQTVRNVLTAGMTGSQACADRLTVVQARFTLIVKRCDAQNGELGPVVASLSLCLAMYPQQELNSC